MTNKYALPLALEKLYENQQAIAAAIDELTLLAEHSGRNDLARNIRQALKTLEHNGQSIDDAIADLKKVH